MQAELGAQRETKLERFLLAAKRRSKPKTRRQVQGLSSTRIVRVKDAKRQIKARKVEEYKKEYRRIRREVLDNAVPLATPQAPSDTIKADDRATSGPSGNGLYFIDTTPSKVL